MNSGFATYRTGRRVSLLSLLLVGLLAGGYGLEPLVHAENPQEEAEDTPETSKPKMEMMCPMMAGLKGVDLYADSPTLLAARAEELGLSEEQKKQLEKIATSARQNARDLLTAEQRDALEELPEGPLSMMQISKMRMKKMAESDSKMMCPMCMKKMQGAAEEGDK